MKKSAQISQTWQKLAYLSDCKIVYIVFCRQRTICLVLKHIYYKFYNQHKSVFFVEEKFIINISQTKQIEI